MQSVSTCPGPCLMYQYGNRLPSLIKSPGIVPTLIHYNAIVVYTIPPGHAMVIVTLGETLCAISGDNYMS